MPAIKVLDSFMAYEEHGRGTMPTVFLHGNPTSSYLWRGVIPHVQDLTRCLAPDLIGMGSSGEPDIAYRFVDHARYLDAWFQATGLDHVVIVGHDWGSALGLDWAAPYPGRVRGAVLLETFLRPLAWSEFPEREVESFRTLRTPGAGEAIALEQNYLIEGALPRQVRSGISEADMDVYRAPYPDPASRQPLLQWLREIPLDGEPGDVCDRIAGHELANPREPSRNHSEAPRLGVLDRGSLGPGPRPLAIIATSRRSPPSLPLWRPTVTESASHKRLRLTLTAHEPSRVPCEVSGLLVVRRLSKTAVLPGARGINCRKGMRVCHASARVPRSPPDGVLSE